MFPLPFLLLDFQVQIQLQATLSKSLLILSVWSSYHDKFMRNCQINLDPLILLSISLDSFNLASMENLNQRKDFEWDLYFQLDLYRLLDHHLLLLIILLQSWVDRLILHSFFLMENNVLEKVVSLFLINYCLT
jgi:hypothetical protein